MSAGLKSGLLFMWISVLLLCVLICTGSANDGCIGSTNYTYSAAVNSSLENGGLFTDLSKPVPCDGTAIGYHFCYFVPLDGLLMNHTIELSVLRYEPFPNGIFYTQVPGSVYTVQISGFHYQANPISCVNISVHEFDIIEGDFVGMYIEQIISNDHAIQGLRQGNVLDIIGNTSNSDDTIWATFPQCQSSDPNVNRQFRLGCFGRMNKYQIQASVIVDYSHGTTNNGGNTGVPTSSTVTLTETPTTVTITTVTESETVYTQTEMSTTEVTEPSTLDPSHSSILVYPTEMSTAEMTEPPTLYPSHSSILIYPTEMSTAEMTEPPTLDPSHSRILIYPTSMLPSSTKTLIPTNEPGAVGTQRGMLIVPLAAAGGCVVLVLLIAVIVTLVVVLALVKRRKDKLELLKWRKERRDIVMDHFVIASEFPASQDGNTPLPYEEPEASITKRNITGEVHANPTYDDSFVSRSTSHVIISEQGNEAECYSEITARQEGDEQEEGIYEGIDEAVQSSVIHTTADKGSQLHRPSYGEASHTPLPYEEPVGTIRRKEDDMKEDMCESPPPHILAMYATVDKGEQRKPSIAPPKQANGLYEHYYKTLEEASTCTGNRRQSTEKFKSPTSSEKDLLMQFEQANFMRIPSKEIKILQHLGAGQFGSVSKGVWKRNKAENIDIAVKTINGSKAKVQDFDRVKLLQEAIIMGQFDNPNVIHFYGMVISKDKVTLVMELATKGDLEHLLNAMLPKPGESVAPNTDKVMLGFCQQVAFGMHYLSAKGFVHRDLAARNILVTQDNVLKIADFGMSRDLANENYYMSQGGKIPVKWTAPEAVNYLKYSTASDVWSYGCLLYEIWSLGQTPFRDYSNTEALAKLSTGYRLSPPPGCPRLIYDIMIRCWNPDPQQRTPFKTLIFELLEPETKVLHIPVEALARHQLAGNIGGPLEAGERMYHDLQQRYIS